MRIRITAILALISTVLSGGTPHALNSVLSTGQWYKIAVRNTGIHTITYQDLVDINMDPANLDPSKIRLFGNGSGMLSETNSVKRFDDLREVPIQVVCSSGNQLQPGDYILFYGESPDAWSYNITTTIFTHIKNLYSDYSYYFITAGTDDGKRIPLVASLDTTPTYYCQRYYDHTFHELDSLNIIKSGKNWLGEVFDNTRNSYSFPYSFQGIDTNSVLRLITNVIAKAPVISKFLISINGRAVDSIFVDPTDPQSLNVYATSKKRTSNIVHPPAVGEIRLDYFPPTESSLGWLDYLELSCQRSLVFTEPQTSFRDPTSIGDHKITEFNIRGTHPGVRIWDVTVPGNIREIQPFSTDSSMKFTCITDSLREYIAFDATGYFPVKLVGPVTNQNLHALQPATLVIIAHADFMEQALQLADFHRQHDQISVLVTPVDDIFNEFSCGEKDISAIRDFIKMLYDRGTSGDQVNYVLLFGDGTYDPKDRLPQNDNFIPTYQSAESLRPLGSYVTDDFYGIMENNEGGESNGTLDLGVGRFPVSTTEQADALISKILHYTLASDTVLSDWRNVITFIADDENNNLHLHQAEQLAGIVADKYPVYNVSKIYLDAYKMIQTPAGARLPDVNAAITDAVTKGTLILNYTGHGGEDGWAAEKVLTIADINSWKNAEKLPVFVTATCEFSRFDNPERLTGGEMVILNPQGGAIALYTTTRLALATSNFKLDSSFFSNLIPSGGGQSPRLGDLIRISKNNNGNNGNVRNFVLLGDPALKIAFPEFNVTTTSINQQLVDSQPDTLLGLSRVRVTGEIVGPAGDKLNGFNGTVSPKVFDKPVINTTIGNTSNSSPEDFAVQNKMLYSGNSTVRNGEFEFEFVVPREISLQFGNGKISYYARNESTDANGYYDNVIIGGSDPNIDPQNYGPSIEMYLDSTNFVSGQRIGKNPELIAFLDDPDGINFFYLGIGHEIIVTIDEDDAHPVVLNDQFQADMDTYGSGSIHYPLGEFTNGFHTLQLKAWDLYDNSSTKEISFLVFEQPTLSVTNVMNSPNPVNDHTIFSFIPDLHNGDLDIQIMIFTLAGQPVKTIEEKYSEAYSTIITIPWDGRSDNNQPLQDGLYFYRLTARGSDGTFTSVSQKLIINH